MILDSVQDTCGISDQGMEPSREILRRYGNMSSATIMFVLAELMEQYRSEEERPGRAFAFGPGLTVEAMDFTLLPARARTETTGGGSLKAESFA
jgi:predicted naringenin-chalcone synthase